MGPAPSSGTRTTAATTEATATGMKLRGFHSKSSSSTASSTPPSATATFGLDAAAADEDRLQRLGDAMAADLLGAVARHDANHQAAYHRDQHRPEAQSVACRRHEVRGEALVVGEVGDDRDQPDQRVGD